MNHTILLYSLTGLVF